MSVSERRETPAILQIDAILSRLSGGAALSEVCRFLRSEFAHYYWIGIYRLQDGMLRLAGWDGDLPTQHPEIPIDRGICGRAAREDRPIVVADVRTDPDYLACFLDARSEIVVPIRAAGRVVGEIDVDGRDVHAYDASDVRFLTRVAEKLFPVVRAVSPPPSVGA